MCVWVLSFIKLSDEGLPGNEAEKLERSFQVVANMSRARTPDPGSPAAFLLKCPYIVKVALFFSVLTIFRLRTGLLICDFKNIVHTHAIIDSVDISLSKL